MENNEKTKITYMKNLTRQNFNLPINIPVDSNANIKTIININSYIYDKKIECSNSKAIFTGKIGVKVVYLDTDNIFNTLFESQTFSESITDTSITSDSHLILENETLVCEATSKESILQISCSVSCSPILYMNISIPNSIENIEGLITKKCEIETTCIEKYISTDFEYTCNLETRNNISKILVYNAKFIPKESSPNLDSVTVSGNIYSTLIYETIIDNQPVLKELYSCNMLKIDFPLSGVSTDQILELDYCVDQSRNEINTEIEDDNSVITINHVIKVCGISLQKMSLELVDDLYSCNNEISLSSVEREFNSGLNFNMADNYVSGENSLQESDSAIDTLVSNSNISCEIANTYIKDETVFIEGIITSQLIYLDENHDYRSKSTELPFVLNTKIYMENLNSGKTKILINDYKTKVKRGTIVELEYSLTINLISFDKKKVQIVDNFIIGKSLDFSKYDYQIYIAHPNETLWELAKRINITLEELCALNKNLPSVMLGNEKVIVKR